jgi:UDP-glucose:(heptosyl)LPS alpha-1,3-glucosyltransferase
MKGSPPLAVLAIRQVQRQTGAVRHAMEQAACLRTMGFRVLVLAERGSRQELSEVGCELRKILRWPIKGLQRRLFFDWLVQRRVQSLRPEVFISHGDARSDDLLFMHNCLHLEAERIPGSSPSAPLEAQRFHHRVLTQSRFRYVVANSELMKVDLVRRFGLDPTKVRVFHQGVDTSEFRFADRVPLRALGRSRLAICPGTRLVGLVTSGNFAKRNVGLFLRVAAIIHRALPDTQFLIVGKDSRVHEYHRQARDLGLASAVTFAPTIREVAQYFHAVDLLLYPAWLEEYGRAVLEGLACGTPALVSTAVGAAEVMTAEGVPELIEGWDETTWAQRALDVLRDPSRMEAMRAAGLQLAKNYSRARRLDALRLLLEQLGQDGP